MQRASICLVNASATGTETLKNLVLPGIRSFTIVDGAQVSDIDRGNNFFVPISQPQQGLAHPKNRAAVTAHALQSLNESVQASYVPQHVDTIVHDANTAFTFVKQFSVVVVSQMGAGHPVVRHLAEGCFRANVPLVIVRAYGLVGSLRIQARELCVVDSKDTNMAPDLRLHDPFDELVRHVDSIDLEAMTDTTAISHVPFVVILLKAVTKYRALHDGRLPKTRAEKNEFKNIATSLRPKDCPDLAENFTEALRNLQLRLCYHDAGEMPHAVRQVLSDSKSNATCEDGFNERCGKGDGTTEGMPEIIRINRGNRGSSPPAEAEAGVALGREEKSGAELIAYENALFWVLAAGVRLFVEKNGRLPLRGSVPDMTADTESYVALQKIYSAKAESDAKAILELVQAIVERYGVDVMVDEACVRSFCKNAHGIGVYRTRSIAEEVERPGGSGFVEAAMMDCALDASASGCASRFYVMLRAADSFYREHGRIAGADTSMKENDVGLLQEHAAKIKEGLGVSGGAALWREQAEEIVRYAGVEVHNVSAFMGGVAGQEIIKLVTRLFVPVVDTLVFNFAEMTSASFAA